MKIKTVIEVNQLTVVGKEKPDWDDNGREWPVYEIPLKELHYNQENGRISTWISDYMNDKSKPDLNSLTREEYNNTIAEFIKNANSAGSFKDLKNDLRKKTQHTPGVVLTDGTIVSGNRRFTVLRALYDETQDEKFKNFRCHIINVPKNNNEREFIRIIETKTSYGVINPEPYYAVERLVSVYRDVIDPDTHLWSIKDYAKKFGMKESEAEKLRDRAYIMADYLNYIDMPKKFYIARIQKIDGPIFELANLFKKLKDTQMPEWNRIKPLFYSEFKKQGDKTRVVRGLVHTYKNNNPKFEFLLTKFGEKQSEWETEQLKNKGKEGKQSFKEQKELASLDTSLIKDVITQSKIKDAREKPIKKADAALNNLNDIDIDILEKMYANDKNTLRNKLKMIQEKINYLNKKLK